jgi:hypothetical protein
MLPTAIDLKAARGDAFELIAGEPFSTFWRWAEPVCTYESYFVDPPGTPLIRIAGTNRVVGTAVQVGAGLVLYLPRLGSEVAYEGSAYKPGAEENRAHRDFLNHLWKVCRQLGGSAVVPDWTNGYLLPGENEAVDALSRAHSRLSSAQKAIQKCGQQLGELRERKVLITGTGPALERIVDRALEALGFDVESGAPGRTDRVIRRKRRTAVVEVKGKAKSASERDAAQLEKWKSDFHAEHGRVPKGILIVNAWRGKPLDERDGLAPFPDQMLRYAVEQRQQCLLTGTQLLGLWLEAEKAPSRADKLARSLMACEGVFPRYQDWREVVDLAEAKD